ncbi:hypothetical protein [Actinomadura sp. WAC 06369]|uniref:hypothetical protein n=1 Tax=Actinomadura sp. WAC 06369 TaxID=2203193 RepID=UPI000F7675A9|nr:hypothetical protein [Actinomadura sp. WAC 06369]RSN48250.1 hypothetical protein DMH08_34550 [Actinomadura sp. WAC 06369]
MIILSGVLVVAAIALLVAGIVAGNGDSAQVFGLDALVVIYISIGVSIVSALCLAIGVFLRRKELFGPGVSTAPAKKRKPRREKRAKPVPAATAAAPGAAKPAGAPEPHDDAVEIPAQPVDVPDDALVFVVRGRKRYHLDTCRQLAGRETEELTYAEAREEGFSSCTACMPDTALAARAKTEPKAGGDKEPKPGQGKEPVKAAERSGAEENGLAGLARPAPTSLDVTAELPRDDAGEKPKRTPAGPTLMDLPVADLVQEKPRESEKPAARDRAAEGEQDGRKKTGLEKTGLEKTGKAETAESAAPEPAKDDAKPEKAETPEKTESRAKAEKAAGEASPADATAELDTAAPRPRGAGEPDETAEVPRQASEPAAEESAAAEPDGDDPQVRILSGTKRYHRTDCALIEDIGDEADDLEALSRTEAKARGCTPCLVCQPDRERARD